FLIYVWFGALKLCGKSPAAPLVSQLLVHLFGHSLWLRHPLLGLIEVTIGVGMLVPRWTRPALLVLLAHLVATTLPLFYLPRATWQAVLVPTLEGQYILKNAALLALAIELAGSELAPFRRPARASALEAAPEGRYADAAPL